MEGFGGDQGFDRSGFGQCGLPDQQPSHFCPETAGQPVHAAERHGELPQPPLSGCSYPSGEGVSERDGNFHHSNEVGLRQINEPSQRWPGAQGLLHQKTHILHRTGHTGPQL